MLNVLMIGDIVGRPGRKAVKQYLQANSAQYDLVIANGENAAGGKGITPEIVYELYNSSVDFITMGNHVWDKKEIIQFIEHEPNIIRPANYPPGTPGKGYSVITLGNKRKIGILNLAGRVFLPAMDCPFRTAANIVKEIRQETPMIIIDFHGEATSEKIAFGWYMDGQVSAVIGTHTHVQTADERILPQGTAYISDVGMTGPRNSVLGMEKEVIIQRFLTQMPHQFSVAKGEVVFCAISLKIDEATGKCREIKRIQEIYSD